MKKLFIILAALLLTISLGATELSDFLKKIEGVVSVEQLENGQFAERYVVMITQPLDHSDPAKGSFQQRFVVADVGKDRPSLLITEGYDGERALSPKYREEISKELNTNQIFVEHRYFKASTPSPRDWQYLGGENAAADLHRIYTTLKPYYTGKWVASGISKGGQNTMIYMSYYPEDMDAAVPYVGPVCFGVEDGRHEPFLEAVGTADERAAIRAFQLEVLTRRGELMPLFEAYVTQKGYKFNVGLDEIFDYCVLEYPFALWQWGTSTEQIPAAGSSADVVVGQLIKIVEPEYFTVDSNASFNVQAARELGYYGYDCKPFQGLLSIKSAKGYMKRIMLPADALDVKFSGDLSKRICKYLKDNDPRMIFIYGENDPWSAAMVDSKFFEGKKNMRVVVEPRGSHRARIKTQPKEVQTSVWQQLGQWLEVEN